MYKTQQIVLHLIYPNIKNNNRITRLPALLNLAL